MDKEQERRITRYFLNSRKFMWGIGRGKKQDEVYKWLKDKGFSQPDGSAYKTNYSDVSHDMIKRYGIERIMKDLVVTPVREYYGDSIDFLRTYWREGRTPEYKDLEVNGIRYEFIYYYRDSSGQEIVRYGPSFLDVNLQFKYIEGWTTWAHIFFEDIEYAFPAKIRRD